MNGKLLFFLFAALLTPFFAESQQKPLSPFGSSGSSILDDAFADMDRAFTGDDFTQEDEYYLGRAAAANILKTYRIYSRSPDLVRYLNRICQAVVINSPSPDLYNGYHVVLLDSAEFNAFSTPGGHIFLTRGLVAAAPSEDALAGVIAHEIAHIQLKHAISLIREMKFTDTAGGVAQRAGNLAGGAAAQRLLAFRASVSGMVDTMMKNGYSQAQEFEADNAATGLLAAAGYDPGGLLEMLRVLQNVQNSQRDGFNNTHPAPALRIANAAAADRQYRAQDTRSWRRRRFINK